MAPYNAQLAGTGNKESHLPRSGITENSFQSGLPKNVATPHIEVPKYAAYLHLPQYMKMARLLEVVHRTILLPKYAAYFKKHVHYSQSMLHFTPTPVMKVAGYF